MNDKLKKVLAVVFIGALLYILIAYWVGHHGNSANKTEILEDVNSVAVYTDQAVVSTTIEPETPNDTNEGSRVRHSSLLVDAAKEKLPRESDPFLQGLESVETLQIDILRNQFLEDSHVIEVLPAPSTPVILKRSISQDDVGKIEKTRSVSITDFPYGVSAAWIIESRSVIDKVDEDNMSMDCTIGTKTIMSVMALPSGIRKLDVDTDIEIKSRKRVFSDNRSEGIEEHITVGNKDVQIASNSQGVLQFPKKQMELGKEYKIDVPVSEELQEIMFDDPAALMVKIARRVKFDNTVAYEVRANQNVYSKVEGLYSKSKLDIKAYVGAQSGKILWCEAISEIVDSSDSSVIGTITVVREE